MAYNVRSGDWSYDSRVGSTARTTIVNRLVMMSWKKERRAVVSAIIVVDGS